MRIQGGQIDFVSIHPPSGHVSIIEAKLQITWGVITQLNTYHKSFGIPDASKIVFSFLPVSEYDIKKLESFDVEVFHLPEEYPTASIRCLDDTLWDFAEIFEDAYNHPIKGRGRSFDYLERTFEPRETTS